MGVALGRVRTGSGARGIEEADSPRSGGDDAAPFAADRDRLPSQLRISGLLDGREKCVGIEMHNHRRRRSDW